MLKALYSQLLYSHSVCSPCELRIRFLVLFSHFHLSLSSFLSHTLSSVSRTLFFPSSSLLRFSLLNYGNERCLNAIATLSHQNENDSLECCFTRNESLSNIEVLSFVLRPCALSEEFAHYSPKIKPSLLW